MKIKTSVTLSEALLQTIDTIPDARANRSDFLEAAAWAYIDELRRRERAQRDLEIYTRRADYLNEEAMDALAYQAGL